MYVIEKALSDGPEFDALVERVYDMLRQWTDDGDLWDVGDRDLAVMIVKSVLRGAKGLGAEPLPLKMADQVDLSEADLSRAISQAVKTHFASESDYSGAEYASRSIAIAVCDLLLNGRT